MRIKTRFDIIWNYATVSIYKICKCFIIVLFSLTLSVLTNTLLQDMKYLGFIEYSAGINAGFISFFSFTSIALVNYVEKKKGWG